MFVHSCCSLFAYDFYIFDQPFQNAWDIHHRQYENCNGFVDLTVDDHASPRFITPNTEWLRNLRPRSLSHFARRLFPPATLRGHLHILPGFLPINLMVTGKGISRRKTLQLFSVSGREKSLIVPSSSVQISGQLFLEAHFYPRGLGAH